MDLAFERHDEVELATRCLTHARGDHTRAVVAFGYADTSLVRVGGKVLNHTIFTVAQQLVPWFDWRDLLIVAVAARMIVGP